MKRFLLVALLLVSAASVYAADLKITGDAEVRGLMYAAEYDGDNAGKDKYFDADFNFNAALVLTENTTVFTKVTFDAENGKVQLQFRTAKQVKQLQCLALKGHT